VQQHRVLDQLTSRSDSDTYLCEGKVARQTSCQGKFRREAHDAFHSVPQVAGGQIILANTLIRDLLGRGGRGERYGANRWFRTRLENLAPPRRP
jgi:hypothetical protein